MAVTYDVIPDVLDAMVSRLEAAFVPGTSTEAAVTVLQDSDETTEARVLELATAKPTILVAWIGTEGARYSSRSKSIEQFAAGIYAGQVPSRVATKRTNALRIASKIARIVQDTVLGNTWGVDGVEVASDTQANNMSGGIPNAEGFALIVVTWKQEIDFPDGVDPSTLEDLHSVYSTVEVPNSPDGETKDEFNTDVPHP